MRAKSNVNCMAYWRWFRDIVIVICLFKHAQTSDEKVGGKSLDSADCLV